MAEEFTDPETIDEAIERRAIDGVQEASDEFGRDVKYMSIDDQIKAANHVGGKAAAKLPGRGLYFTKLIPPGTG